MKQRTKTRGKQSKERRRAAAESLRQARERRSPQQQLAKLNREGWDAKRERARLQTQIDGK